AFCDVAVESVISAQDASSIYEVPLMLEKEGLAQQTLELFQMEQREPDLTHWQRLVDRLHNPTHHLEIAIVGKYIKLTDAYLSVVEALEHAAIAKNTKIKIHWVSAEDVEAYGPEPFLNGFNGILIPGGFGIRGVDGKIQAIRYARENQIPLLGLCLGMQCSVVEWAKHMAFLEDAHSAEFFTDIKNPVIHLLPEQQDVVDLGGTMRLGLYPCRIAPNTLASSLYQEEVIYERHRHRYEFNNAYRNLFLETGYVISGTSPDGRLVEIIELKQHPFFIATQFHPEFSSRPSRPHPLFVGFVQATLDKAQLKQSSTNGSTSQNQQSVAEVSC
ncbi:MAG: CTP synthase, partial [Moorea sp. SIO2I5]|nr:CTP synthase [Moorena sp. SIO2I5]